MAKEIGRDDDYLKRTGKLIPAEAIAAFVTSSSGVIAAQTGVAAGSLGLGLLNFFTPLLFKGSQ